MRYSPTAAGHGLIAHVYAVGRCWAARFFLSVLLLGFCFARSAAADEVAYERFLGLYDGMLSSHLHPARANGVAYQGVDYDAWARDPRHAEARQLVAALDPQVFGSLPEKLAFWINIYNFLTVDLIVETGERETIRNLGTLFQTPWQKHEWRVGSQEFTLDDIEHEILRQLSEPRIHFAINCAALSCPDLRGEAYRPERLADQLDDQLRRTLSDPSKGMRATAGGEVLYVSKIFDWFEEDFAGGNVPRWLREGAQVPIPADVILEYLPYDWSLNSVSGQ